MGLFRVVSLTTYVDLFVEKANLEVLEEGVLVGGIQIGGIGVSHFALKKGALLSEFACG